MTFHHAVVCVACCFDPGNSSYPSYNHSWMLRFHGADSAAPFINEESPENDHVPDTNNQACFSIKYVVSIDIKVLTDVFMATIILTASAAAIPNRSKYNPEARVATPCQ